MSNEPESVMDTVKPEILDVAVSHNLIRAIHSRCAEVSVVTAPMMFSLMAGKEPSSDTLGRVVNNLMHLLAVVDDMAVLLRDHIDFTPITVMEKSELAALKEAVKVHPVVLKAIQYDNETAEQKLDRIMREHDGA